MIPDNSNPDGGIEITALKNQVFTLLVALVVISGTLTTYLYRQASTEGKELALGEHIEASMSTNEVVFQTFITQLVAYGGKHPDFVPVLKKYGIAPISGVPANAPALPSK